MHICKSLLDVQSFFDALYVIYQISEIKDDSLFVSQFPCLLGHPVRDERFYKNGILCKDETSMKT